LLIQGQVEKNRYKDSMRQVQQLVQQAIRDTENGYFPGVSGTNSGTVLAGKRIYFCTDSSVANSDTSTRQPCTVGSNTIRVENIYWNSTLATNPTPDTDGVAAPTFDTDFELNTGKVTYTNYPGGIRYTKFKKNGVTALNSSSAGFAIMFNNVDPLNLTTQSVKLSFPYIDNNNSSSTEDDWLGEYNDNGMLVCFEGYNNGSLVIGRGGILSVEMNLDDTRCD
jgi:hypothetical protein